MDITVVRKTRNASVATGASHRAAIRPPSRARMLARGGRGLVALAGIVATLLATSNAAATPAAPRVASKAAGSDIRNQIYICNFYRDVVSRNDRGNPYYYNTYQYARCQYLYRHYNVTGERPSGASHITVKQVITACIKGAVGGTTIAGIISQITSVKGAVRFVIRRVGILAALSCLGTIVYEFA